MACCTGMFCQPQCRLYIHCLQYLLYFTQYPPGLRLCHQPRLSRNVDKSPCSDHKVNDTDQTSHEKRTDYYTQPVGR